MQRFAMIFGAAVWLAAAAWAEEPKAPVQAETVVHTFADEAQMQAFGELWRQRQSSALRMSVLQAYWNEEQAVIAQVNDRLKAEFKVDPAKNYSLDPQRRVLLEQPAVPGTEGNAASGGSPRPGGP